MAVLKSKPALTALIKVLVSLKYGLLAVVASLFLVGLSLYAVNLELLKYVLFDGPLTFAGKLDFFAYGYGSVLTNYDSARSVGLILISILFGINTALFVYVLRRRGLRKIPKKSGIGALCLVIVSSGCVACGTSLAAPILATLGAASGALLRDVSTILNWLGSGLLVYSIYKLSLIAAIIQAPERKK